MGICRAMCRGGYVPFWRRRSTLIWVLIILAAATYLIYTRTSRHKTIMQNFMDILPNKQGSGDHSADGFWDRNGGKELAVKHGIFRMRPHKFVNKNGGGDRDQGFWNMNGGKELDVQHRRFRMRPRKHNNVAQSWNPHQVPVTSTVANVEKPNDEIPKGGFFHKNDEFDDAHQMANQNQIHGLINKKVNVEHVVKVHHDVVQKVEIEGKELDSQVVIKEVVDGLSSSSPPPTNSNQGVHGHVQVDKEHALSTTSTETRQHMQHNIINHANIVTPKANREQIKKILADEAEKLKALKHKLKLHRGIVPVHVDKVVNRDAGIIDAALPSKETLESWNYAQVASTFHNYLMVPQVECAIIARMGKEEHGGWDVCHSDRFRPHSPCLMYSFGRHSDFTFEDDVAKRYGCETHYFDPEVSLKYGDSRLTGVTLHKIQLSSEDGRTPNNWKVRTLASIRQELHHSQQIDILKVDIEENEWRTLPQLLESDSLVLVRQLLIELHVMMKETSEPSKEDYIRYMMLLRSLHTNGFRIAKTTADEARRLSSSGVSRPYNYEVLFLRSGI